MAEKNTGKPDSPLSDAISQAGEAAAACSSGQDRLSALLLSSDLVGQGALDEAKKIQKESGGFLGQILIEQKILDQDDLTEFLVKNCKIPHLNLMDYDISPNIVSLLPKELCKTHFVLPIDKLGRILTVAMVNPLNYEALAEIREACPDLRIKPILCNWRHFEIVASKFLGKEGQQNKNAANLSISSLGLTNSRPTPKQKTPPAPEPASLSEPQQASPAEPGAAVAAPVMSPDMMAAMMRESMGEALKEAMDSISPAPPQTVEPSDAMTPEDMAAMMRESMGAALKEAMGAMANQFGEMVQSIPAAAPQPDPNQVSEIVRMSVQEAVRESAEQQSKLAEITQSALESLQEATARAEAAAAQAEEAVATQEEAATTAVDTNPPAEQHASDALVREALDAECLLETLTLDIFMPGKANAFTFQLSKAVTDHPGGDYNPFFLYGNVGVGKTHLITGIGNAIMTAHPECRAGYISASNFSQRLRDAMHNGTLEAFRNHYATWDVMILDDIQFIGGKVEAQEEFFHIFNALLQQGRQIIIASDKAPDKLGMLEDRLVSRFASGIVAELKPPEWETRICILKRQAEQTGSEIPDEVFSYLAMQLASDVRKMMGALRKIIAYSNLGEREISCEMAQEVLHHMGIAEVA